MEVIVLAGHLRDIPWWGWPILALAWLAGAGLLCSAFNRNNGTDR